MFSELIKRTITSIVIFVLTFYCFVKGSYFFNTLILLIFFTSIYEWYKLALNKLLFIFFSFFSTYQIRFNLENDQNLIFFLLIILVCVSTDIGGYIFGKIFKGPKLTKISPNKTYAGVVGGFLCSLILIYLISIFLELFYKFNLVLISYILFISLISQTGDLIVSYFKRLSNIKDTGKLIPGHGGILDRIDGMIFAFPIIYIFELLF